MMLPFSKSKDHIPLAERMRPLTIDNFIGQEHILKKGHSLRRLIENDNLGSIILWGPPGIGKTTLARIIANVTKKRFKEISAVNSGVADLKSLINSANKILETSSKQTILFIDEIHRFNKAQQDVVLPYVENGTLKLIGSTTENPSFEVIPSLRSRCNLFKLKFLSHKNILNILENAFNKDNFLVNLKIEISQVALEKIALKANGDARFALNALEAAFLSVGATSDNGKVKVDEALIDDIIQQSFVLYDKTGNEHYDHASAFQKSLRGSDPNAAVYWLAKMIAGGENPRFIARRLIVTASEDIGNANPQALILAVTAAEAAEKLGFPEGRIPLCQAAIYIATSPKSNSSIQAIDNALNDIKYNGKSYPVPDHLKDSHYKDAKNYGFGKGYKYPHDYRGNYVEQNYMPEQIKDISYYFPGENEK